MSRILLSTSEALGHLSPCITLLKHLQKRGHDVAMVGRLDGEDLTAANEIRYIPIAHQEYPKGSVAEDLKQLGEKKGREGFKFTIDMYRRKARANLTHMGGVLKTEKPDLMIIDQTYTDVVSVAQVYSIPHVTICCALNLMADWNVPPSIFPMAHKKGLLAKFRNKIAFSLYAKAVKPIRTVIDEFRIQNGLKAYPNINSSNSLRLILSQTTDAFDLPRRHLPQLKNVGPLIDENLKEDLTTFPFDLIEGKEFVYVSLGSIQNRVPTIFKQIAEACDRLNLKAVITTGHGCEFTPGELAGDPIVVPFAPQTALLKQAKFVITHAGMNTAMAALKFGLPMVAIPITNEQPGIAARIEHSGSGIWLRLNELNVDKIEGALSNIASAKAYRDNAKRIQQSLELAGGARRAADLVEGVLESLTFKKLSREATSSADFTRPISI